MRFRFLISHEIEGSVEVNQPDGWKEAVLKLERHEEFHSLVEFFEGSFILYGDNGIVNGGIEFVKLIERTHGPDTTIIVDIDLTYDEITFSNVFNGQYKIVDLEEMPDNKMRIPIVRDDFWAKFISRIDTPVDLKSPKNLDDEETAIAQEINVKLQTQKVRQTFSSKFDDGQMIEDPGNDFLNEYIQIEPNVVDLDEIKEKFTLPNATNPEKPVWQWEMEYAGEYTWDMRIEASDHTVVGAGGHPLSGLAKMFIQFNEEPPIEWTLVDHDDGVDESSSFTYQATKILAAGTIVRIYAFVNATLVGRFYIWGETNSPVTLLFPKNPPSGITTPSYFHLVGNTIFQQTNSPSFFIHDAAAAIVDRTTGTIGRFYSEHLGSDRTTARQYEQNGCAWKYAISKGLQIRQYSLSEKPFFLSFNQWWKGVNPILNLSLGYDTIDGNQVIRVEEQEYQYQLTDHVVYISNARITRKYDQDVIFNKVEIGYARWESEDAGSIDDPQTKHTYASRFEKIGKPIQLFSDFIGASIAWETTRRQTRVKAADYKYDNETFIVALNPDLQEESPDISPDLLQFIPEFDENFSSVTNLLNSDSRYNLRITPARNFLRWQKYLQGALQDYVGSAFKFTGGQGNYDMTSTMLESCDVDNNEEELSEKEDIGVTADFLHISQLLEIEHFLEWEDYQLIRDNRRKPIAVSQTSDDHFILFIKSLSYVPAKGTCTILGWPIEYVELNVPSDTMPMLECQPSSDECEKALTDEDGNILTNELGVCITE